MASLRATIRDDPFIRRALQVLVLVAIILVIMPPLFVLYFGYFAPNLPYRIEFFIDEFLTQPVGMPVDISAILLGAAPIVLAGVCYRTDSPRRILNRLGKIASVIAIIGTLAGFFGLVYLRSADVPSAVFGGQQVLQNMADLCQFTLTACVFYIATFFGISGGKT